MDRGVVNDKIMQVITLLMSAQKEGSEYERNSLIAEASIKLRTLDLELGAEE